ncbi:acid protease [Aspergillus steynii IBT 23096]|uniref:Acid protease n=1 Tax=Aspergillus steynii IBT 23096 TaxID=1392250 RepID=A0A2I2G6K1_9EURO|nr:acid protease [Aspergillus steynii IBT 23096]PLB48507.1 acid protease [Aspergillus steynii IBT 23096]
MGSLILVPKMALGFRGLAVTTLCIALVTVFCVCPLYFMGDPYPLVKETQKIQKAAFTTPLTIQNNYFIVDFTLGSPPQPFRGVPAISWRPVVLAPASYELEEDVQYIEEHGKEYPHKYNSSLSSTAVVSDTLVATGDRMLLSGVGNMSYETLNVAGIQAANQSFVALSGIGQEIPSLLHIMYGGYGLFDGAIGLSPSNRPSKSGLESLWMNIARQDILDAHILSLKPPRPGSSELGEMAFGITEDYQRLADRLVRMKVEMNSVSREFIEPWQVEGRAIYSGSNQMQLQPGNHTVRFSTETPLLLLPKESIRDVLNATRTIVTDNKGWSVPRLPCEARADIPDVTIDIGGHNFTITPYDFLSEVRYSDGSVECAPQIGTSDGNFLLLGGPFLKKFYSVWDRDNMEIGLAPLSELER